MKLFLLACLLGVALCQDQPWTCGQCDSPADRSNRTGCRSFCYYSQNRPSLTKADIQREFDRMQQNGVVTRAAFVPNWQQRTQMCENECNNVFDVLATADVTSDPEVITQSDVDENWNDLNPDGLPSIDASQYNVAWSLNYEVTHDPACTSGL